MQEYLYILLSQTGTKVSRCIKLFTRKPYNHASVAVDLSLEELYSFCRNDCRHPLPATFNREIVGSGTFGMFHTIPCEIYAIPITSAEKQKFRQYIEYLKASRSLYSYNLLGLCTTFLHIRWTRKKKMHCAEFVANVLQYVGVKLSKQPSLYTPDDLRYVQDALLVYRGELNHFYQVSAQHASVFARKWQSDLIGSSHIDHAMSRQLHFQQNLVKH